LSEGENRTGIFVAVGILARIARPSTIIVLQRLIRVLFAAATIIAVAFRFGLKFLVVMFST
jgi:hypothetical protein